MTAQTGLRGLSTKKIEILAQFLKEEGFELPGAQAIPPRQRRDEFPLSFAQERLWFLEHLTPGEAVYNVSQALRLSGPLDHGALQQSLAAVIQRHEVLRSNYLSVHGQPVQIIRPESDVPITLVDLSETAAAAREQALRQQARAAVQQPFDLERDPLVRALIFRLGPQEHVLLLVLHHIVFDGWSEGVFYRELAGLYAACAAGRSAALPPPPIQYADYAHWQRQRLQGEARETLLGYWTRQLAGAPVLTDLPTDRPRPPTPSYRGTSHLFTVPGELVETLTALGQREGATLFMTLLAAFQVLLARYSRQDDVVVGTPIAGRTRAETADLIGFFINTLALRADLSDQPTFRQLLGRVREMTLDAYAHQDLPFEQLVEALQPERDLSHTPLFQTMFVLQNTSAAPLELGGLVVQPFTVDDPVAKVDLQLELRPAGQGLQGRLQYSVDLFDAATVARMAEHFLHLLAGLAAQPDAPVMELPLLPAAERERVLSLLNGAPRSFRRDRTLHALFEVQAERTPDAVALTCEDQQLTYRALNERANRLAHRLRSHGVGPAVLVGLCAERSPELLVGILGILKAGGAYLPLDPAYPPDRLAFMLADAQAPVLVTQRHLCGELPASAALVVCIEDQLADSPELAANPPGGAAPDDPAYVIYTSGSTGTPKGVLVSHANVTRLFAATQDWFGFDQRDVWTLFHSVAFDFSVWEIWGALLHGGRLVVVPYLVSRSPEEFYSLVVREQVTVLNQTPSAFYQLMQVDAAAPAAALPLRAVIFGGEALDLARLRPWVARHGDQRPRLVNMYGITETTVHVTYRPITEADIAGGRGSLIGRPIPDLQLYVLDAARQPVPVGVPGELYVGGAGVARGYLNRPDLTDARFVPSPFGERYSDTAVERLNGLSEHSESNDERSTVLPLCRSTILYRTGDLVRLLPDGELVYLGRIDQQVKIRGFRIELGEIEAALGQHPAVRELAVVAHGGPGGDTRLAAYIVPDSAPAPTVTALRSFLQTTLPDYMIPAAFVFLDKLPLTSTGKLDRRALPAPEKLRPSLEDAYVAPRTPLEETLAGIWAEVLGLARVGIHDNFFALGGDSIRSVQIAARAKERGIRFSLQSLFRYQTIADLALQSQPAAEGASAAPASAPFSLVAEADRRKLPPDVEDAYPATLLQAGMIYHMELTADSPDYHNVNSFHLRCAWDLAHFRTAVRLLIARHPILRTSFDLSNYSEPLQLVHRTAAMDIAERDIRHLPDAEQARLIRAFVEEAIRRPFDLAHPPLVQFHIHRRSDTTFQLTVVECHPILDGWSLSTMLAELFQHYLALVETGAPPDLPALTSTFRDFVASEQAALTSTACQLYWEDKLRGAEALRIPRWPEAHRPPEPQRSRVLRVHISDELSDGLYLLAKRASVPLKSVLLTAHLRVMSAMSGQSDVLTAVVSHGRLAEKDGEHVLGLFLNSLPFRMDLTGGTWLDLIRATFEAECEMLPYRHYPLAAIQQRWGGREALFEALFNYTHFHRFTDLYQVVEQVEPVIISEPSSNPLQIGFYSDPVTAQVCLRLEYHTSIIAQEQIEALGNSYLAAMHAMVQQPAGRHERVTLLAERERSLLCAVNSTARDYDREVCMHELFERQAEQRPEAVAVVCEGAHLTYRELNRQANQLARHLKGLGVGPGTLVAVSMERCLEMIPALLGILKAGAAYVPIERKWPASRAQWIITSLKIEHIITRHTHLPALEALQPSPLRHVICLDAQTPPAQTAERRSVAPAGVRLWTQTHLSGLRSDNLPPQASADDLAYIIFTSGSTGTPKGVMVRHKPVINLIEWANRTFTISPADRVLFVTALSFDLSVYDIFGLLAAGGSIQVVSDHDLADPARLLSLLCDEPVTFWDSAPAAFQQLVPFFPTVGARGGASQLRLVFFSGDWIPVTLPDHVRGVFPRAQVISLGGATEATVWSNYYPIGAVDPRWKSIPYGKPIQNAQYYVLDRHLNRCPIGTPGDLYIGGECLATGYVNEPLLTAQKFIPDPFSPQPGGYLYRTGDLARYWPDGNLEFLGRNDHQVKIRGFRIELGEIEAALGQHPAVRESVVVAREDVLGEKRLVAYIVPKHGPDAAGGQAAAPGAGELRLFLQAALPDYMVPSAFVLLEALPLGPTKKVDRGALPAPDQSRPELVEVYVAPRTSVERELAELWAQVLRIERVGAEDDFFALGGNSLLATQVVTRVRDQFQIDCTLRSFFERPTVVALAEQIEHAQWADVSLELAAAAIQGEREEGVL